MQYVKTGAPSNPIANIPDAPDVTYSYITAGDKARVENVDYGTGNDHLGYDSEGRLAEVRQIFTGRESYPLYTNYIWDSLDRLKENTYPIPYGAGEIRKKVEPSYDIASRLQSLKFGGVNYDRSDATGLDYAMNRHYSSAQGRFTQVDPIGMGAASLTNPQSLNLYGYTQNDPVNSTDPTGLCAFNIALLPTEVLEDATTGV